MVDHQISNKVVVGVLIVVVRKAEKISALHPNENLEIISRARFILHTICQQYGKVAIRNGSANSRATFIA